MRFESKAQRDELIKSFEEKAKELTTLKQSDHKTDKNYNCKVLFDTRTEYDSEVKVQETIKRDNFGKPYGECIPVEFDEEGKALPISGDIYVFYIRQPNLDQTIKILTAAKPPLGNEYNSGKEAWDIMIDKKESSQEIFTDRIKLGYLLRLIDKIDALLSDQKKS